MKYGVNTVHIPVGMSPKPRDFEYSAAVILSQFFQAEVNFIERSALKTSDIEINGQLWEIKSPTGDGARTIQNNLRKAYRQSRNIVLDLRRCKMRGDRAIGHIKPIISHTTQIKRLLVITKNGKIIVIL